MTKRKIECSYSVQLLFLMLKTEAYHWLMSNQFITQHVVVSSHLELERKEIKNIEESLVGLASITKATFDLWRVSYNRNKSSFYILQHSDWYFKRLTTKTRLLCFFIRNRAKRSFRKTSLECSFYWRGASDVTIMNFVIKSWNSVMQLWCCTKNEGEQKWFSHELTWQRRLSSLHLLI